MKPRYLPERAKEFSEMLMNAFRYKLTDATDVAILASVCKAWGMKLKRGEYPDSLLSIRLVSRKAVNADVSN